jgi:hypothetical protein
VRRRFVCAPEQDSDPKLDLDLELDSELTPGNQPSKSLLIASSAAALATKLLEFNNKIQYCHACGILLSYF